MTSITYPRDKIIALSESNLSIEPDTTEMLRRISMPSRYPTDKICSDGERTQHLLGLAGEKFAKGLGQEDVLAICRGWNQKNTPPLNDEKVRSTVESIYKLDRTNHPDRYAADHEGNLFDVNSAKAGRYFESAPPPQRWLLKDCLPYGKVGLIVAQGGMGKTQFAIQLGMSVVTGKHLAGYYEVGETGAALLLLAEDDDEVIHRRVRHIAEELYLSDPASLSAIYDHLYIKSMVGKNNLMTENVAQIGVKSTRYADRLLKTIEGIPDLKLIIIDPVSRFRGGIENSAEDTTRFVEELERVCLKSNTTLLCMHHANKGSLNVEETNQNAVRGSSALTDGMRWQMNLVPPSKSTTKELGLNSAEQKLYLEAHVVKNNYGPTGQRVILRRTNSGYLQYYKQGNNRHFTLEEHILGIIFHGHSKANNKISAAAFEEKYGGEDGALKAGKTKVRKTIQQLLAAGKLKKALSKLEVDLEIAGSDLPKDYTDVISKS